MRSLGWCVLYISRHWYINSNASRSKVCISARISNTSPFDKIYCTLLCKFIPPYLQFNLSSSNGRYNIFTRLIQQLKVTNVKYRWVGSVKVEVFNIMRARVWRQSRWQESKGCLFPTERNSCISKILISQVVIVRLEEGTQKASEEDDYLTL